MELLDVKENQTHRGVKMSKLLINIIKTILILFVLLFAYNSFGNIECWDSKYSKNPDCIKQTSDKEVKEEENTEEEPDCE